MRVVEEIESPVILGMDFMVRHGVNIDNIKKEIIFENNTAIKMDEDYIASLLGEKEARIENNYVKLNNNLVIYLKITQTIHIDKEPEEESINACTLVVHKGLSLKVKENQREVNIEIYNGRNIPITIYKDQKICEIKEEPKERIHNVLEKESNQGKNEGKKYEGLESEKVRDEEGNEIYIEKGLTKIQRRKALELIDRYMHLFITDLKKLKKVKTEPYEIISKTQDQWSVRCIP